MSATKLKVCSWNTLYKEWVTPEEYPYVKDEERSWEFRLPRLRKTIAEMEADIICLQEIHKHDFGSDFGEFFDELGFDYNVNLSKKNRIPMSCAVLWRRSALRLERCDWRSRSMVVLFEQLAADRRPQKACEKAFVCAVNCHLEGAPQKHDVRFQQIKSALSRVEFMLSLKEYSKSARKRAALKKRSKKKKGKRKSAASVSTDARMERKEEEEEYTDDGIDLSADTLPLIVCGDLNSSRHSCVYQTLANCGLKSEFRDWEHSEVLVTEKDFAHPFELSEAYTKHCANGVDALLGDGCEVGDLRAKGSGFLARREFEVCGLKPTFAADCDVCHIDFIFYTHSRMQLLQAADPIPDSGILDAVLSTELKLPNGDFVSDHFPIAATFQFGQPPTGASPPAREWHQMCSF